MRLIIYIQVFSLLCMPVFVCHVGHVLQCGMPEIMTKFLENALIAVHLAAEQFANAHQT